MCIRDSYYRGKYYKAEKVSSVTSISRYYITKLMESKETHCTVYYYVTNFINIVTAVSNILGKRNQAYSSFHLN